jgi:hypothetical protein
MTDLFRAGVVSSSMRFISPAKLFLRKLRVTADLRIASATVVARCSGGVSEY